MKTSRTLFVFILLLTSCISFAENGRVVRVLDGDTIEVLTTDNKSIRVRLLEIDAPEKKQAFGQKSKDALEAICAGKNAELIHTDTDRYGRTLARVYCGGADANLVMVERGMAWAYVRYAKDPAILKAEKDARRARRGLWVDKAPIPPWEFRRK